VVIEARGDHVERPGAQIALQADPQALFLFDAKTGFRLR
jgi:lactose/L-arabinose transport system ATP-binding protein